MTIKYRKLDPHDDYTFGQNHDDFLTDAEAVAQAIKTRLRLFLGEWWEQIDDGVPYFEAILGQFNSEQASLSAKHLISKCVIETPGVKSIIDLQTNTANRSLTVTMTVDTLFGEITVKE